MSYILDALRRADAERERGAVPGLHAQPLRTQPAAGQEPSRRGTAPWLWLASGLIVVVGAGAVAWWWLRPAEPLLAAPVAPAAAVTAAPSAMPTAPTPAPAPTAPAPVAAAPPVARPTAPAAAPATRRAAATALPAPSTAAAVRAVPPTGGAPARSEREPAAVAEPLQAAAPAAPAAPALTIPPPAPPTAPPTTPNTVPAPAAAAARLPTARELPEDIRRELPALTVNGASYSDTPANRLLIVNGQLFHEGDKVGTDHVLEQIRLKSAVLRFKGTRYVIDY